MVEITFVDAISIVSGIISMILAFVAIWFAIKAEKESRDNYERTKTVLSKIEEKSAVVETTVTTAQKQLLDTVTKILEETAIPQKTSPDEQMGMVLLQMMSQDPKSFATLMETFKPMMQNQQKEE